MDLQRVGVVGASPVGAGLAQLCAQSGLEVVLCDESESALDWAENQVLRGLHRVEIPAAFSLLRRATVLARLEACDLVVECGEASPRERRELLRRLDAHLEPETVLAVQMTTVPVGELASAVENPQRLVGMHFLTPVTVSQVVEVTGGRGAEAALTRAVELTRRLGKSALRCGDRPGLVLHRVTRPFLLVPMRLVEEGRAAPAALDAALRERLGLRVGPFEWADHVGLEEDLALSGELYERLGRPDRLRPSGLEAKLIARGCRGRRNSRGFYVYGENPRGTENPLVAELSPASPKPMPLPEALRAMVAAVAEEARSAVDEGVAPAAEIDRAFTLGAGWPKGPLTWAKELGLA